MPIFFRCASGPAPSASGTVCRLRFRWPVPPRDCTKHVLRVCRHPMAAYREYRHGSLRPRNFSVPSYRPMQTRGCTAACASEAQVRVRGSPQEPSGTCATNLGAGAGVQSNARTMATVPPVAWWPRAMSRRERCHSLTGAVPLMSWRLCGGFSRPPVERAPDLGTRAVCPGPCDQSPSSLGMAGFRKRTPLLLDSGGFTDQ